MIEHHHNNSSLYYPARFYCTVHTPSASCTFTSCLHKHRHREMMAEPLLAVIFNLFSRHINDNPTLGAFGTFLCIAQNKVLSDGLDLLERLIFHRSASMCSSTSRRRTTRSSSDVPEPPASPISMSAIVIWCTASYAHDLMSDTKNECV